MLCRQCGLFPSKPHICWRNKSAGLECNCKAKDCFSLKEVAKAIFVICGFSSSKAIALANYAGLTMNEVKDTSLIQADRSVGFEKMVKATVLGVEIFSPGKDIGLVLRFSKEDIQKLLDEYDVVLIRKG